MAYAKSIHLKPGDVYRIEASDIGAVVIVRRPDGLPSPAPKPVREPGEMTLRQQEFQAKALAVLAADPTAAYRMTDLCILAEVTPSGACSAALKDLEQRGMIYDANRINTHSQKRRHARWRLIPMDTHEHD